MLVAFLALAAAAAAKGPSKAVVCGASGCRDGDALLFDPLGSRAFSLVSAPKPTPYYAVILSSTSGEPYCWRLLWVPARRLLRVENLGRDVPWGPVAGRYWRTVDPAYGRRLARGVAGVTPYPARRAWRAPSRCAP